MTITCKIVVKSVAYQVKNVTIPFSYGFLFPSFFNFALFLLITLALVQLVLSPLTLVPCWFGVSRLTFTIVRVCSAHPTCIPLSKLSTWNYVTVSSHSRHLLLSLSTIVVYAAIVVASTTIVIYSACAATIGCTSLATMFTSLCENTLSHPTSFTTTTFTLTLPQFTSYLHPF